MNAPVTLATRSVSRLTGREWEFAITHLPRVGPVSAPLPNGEVLRLWSRGDDWISNQVFWRGWDGYEPETTPLFFRLARDAAITIDVGAYVGYFSILAALANRQGRVFAFEPMGHSIERLRRHVELNSLTNVELVAAAVAAAEGRAELFHLGGFPCSTSLVREFMSPHPHVQSFIVPIVALDEFVEERGLRGVSLVKLDIETGEPAALRGMRRVLERDRPTIFCEVLSDAVGSESESVLAPLDYRFYHLTPEGPVVRDEVVPHPEWLNYLFTPMSPAQVATLADESRRLLR